MGHAQYDTDGFDQAAASRPRERVAVKGCIFKDGRLLGRPFVGPRSQADIREYLSANGVL